MHRTLPFTLTCQSIAVLWYAPAGHHPADVAEHRARAPWYTTKAEPSTADMTAKLRRVLIAAKYLPVHPSEPTPQKSTPSGWPGKAPPRNRESRGEDAKLTMRTELPVTRGLPPRQSSISAAHIRRHCALTRQAVRPRSVTQLANAPAQLAAALLDFLPA